MSKVKLIISPPGSFKTTVLFHYTYNQISLILDKFEKEHPGNAQEEELPYAVVLTSKRKLNDKQLIFGTYSEVLIPTLK